MHDDTVQVGALRKHVAQFVLDRDWEQFHTPKNLTVAISVEAAELMEIFQWATSDESIKMAAIPETRARLKEELADVIIYCLALANRTSVEISDAVMRKIQQSAAKYPVDVYKGGN